MADTVICPHCLGHIAPGLAECPACRHSMENHNPHGALAYGTVLAERYTIGDFLAADGEGILYQAVENKGGVRVTLKEYLPVTLAEDRGEDGTVHPKAGSEVLYKTTRMDFSELYRELMKITPATGLEAVLDVLEANNTAYAVMENPGGIPLSHFLDAAGGVIAPAEARSMLQPVFEGVAAMHTAGLVHRGVSPENIRVLDNGKARLSGYATLGLRTAGSALRAQLYEGYSAPEQYSAAEFVGRYTDEYALAAVFYRMVTGQAPVSAGQRRVADSNPPARGLEPTIPNWLSDVLQRGLALKPSERIQTVPELMSSLSSPDTARAILGETRREKLQKQKLTRMLTGAIVLMCILICLLLWWALGRRVNAPSSSVPAPTATPAPQMDEVPNFVGLKFSDVTSADQYTDIYRFDSSTDYSDEYDKGVVISQSPAAGTELGPDDDHTITLVVSRGPQQVKVPYVVGFPQSDAVAELEAAGLHASCFMVANDGSLVAGCVVKTDPVADTQVDTGSTVTVYIAAEDTVTIPPTATPDPSTQVDTTSNPSSLQGFD